MAKFANIFVDQGTTFSEVIDLSNNDGSVFPLAGFVAVAKARKNIWDANPVIFNTVIDTVAGTITISLAATVSALLSPVDYIYDVLISNATTGEVIKIVQGTMVVIATESL